MHIHPRTQGSADDCMTIIYIFVINTAHLKPRIINPICT